MTSSGTIRTTTRPASTLVWDPVVRFGHWALVASAWPGRACQMATKFGTRSTQTLRSTEAEVERLSLDLRSLKTRTTIPPIEVRVGRGLA